MNAAADTCTALTGTETAITIGGKITVIRMANGQGTVTAYKVGDFADAVAPIVAGERVVVSTPGLSPMVAARHLQRFSDAGFVTEWTIWDETETIGHAGIKSRRFRIVMVRT